MIHWKGQFKPGSLYLVIIKKKKVTWNKIKYYKSNKNVFVFLNNDFGFDFSHWITKATFLIFHLV